MWPESHLLAFYLLTYLQSHLKVREVREVFELRCIFGASVPTRGIHHDGNHRISAGLQMEGGGASYFRSSHLTKVSNHARLPRSRQESPPKLWGKCKTLIWRHCCVTHPNRGQPHMKNPFEGRESTPRGRLLIVTNPSYWGFAGVFRTPSPLLGFFENPQ